MAGRNSGFFYGKKMDLKYFKIFDTLIGVDEVGRGPIAGPVTACGVSITNENSYLLGVLKKLNVTDSKKLSEKKRITILEELNINPHKLKMNNLYNIEYKNYTFSFYLHSKTPKHIDKVNILQASLQSMKKCSDSLETKRSHTLIDGNKTFESISCEAVVKGDSKSIVIGLASIIAKEYRDNLMKRYSNKYPGYGLERHAGYPTKFHKQAVTDLGVTPIHRKSFAGVKEHL
jgi:ribonuclease HII